MNWGSWNSFDYDPYQGWGAAPPPPPGGADVASAAADLVGVGAQIGELISANKFKNQMLRASKIEAKEAKIAARRNAKFARRDQQRVSMLQARLAALRSISGGRTTRGLVAVGGVIVLAGLFLLAVRKPKKSPPQYQGKM